MCGSPTKGHSNYNYEKKCSVIFAAGIGLGTEQMFATNGTSFAAPHAAAVAAHVLVAAGNNTSSTSNCTNKLLPIYTELLAGHSLHFNCVNVCLCCHWIK